MKKYGIWGIEHLIQKIENPKNEYVLERMGIWLRKSENYAHMMLKRGNKNSAEKYWYFKTLYMYNKICPNLVHELPKPNDKSTTEERLSYMYENSQTNLEYTERAYKQLEKVYEEVKILL